MEVSGRGRNAGGGGERERERMRQSLGAFSGGAHVGGDSREYSTLYADEALQAGGGDNQARAGTRALILVLLLLTTAYVLPTTNY